MYIYKIENKINHKVYIGQTTKDPMKRFKEHGWDTNAGSSRALCRAIRKYGVDSFSIETLFCVTDPKQLDELEIQFIEEYNSFKAGYNMTLGGAGNLGNSRPNTWSAKAVETRKRNGNSCAVKTSNYLVEDLTTNTIIEGNNLTLFCRENSLSIGNLWETFYGRRKQHKGFVLVRTFNDYPSHGSRAEA